MKITIKDISTIIKNANEAVNKAIEQFKIENPGVDVEALLSEQNGLPPEFAQISSREVDKFVAYAKEQGIKMPFDSIEAGILAAGRKDMQNGLADILNAIDPGKPACLECDEVMDNRGRSKKKL
jgi:hypothetical protein